MSLRKCALCRRQPVDSKKVLLLPSFLLPYRNPSIEVQSRIKALHQTHIFCNDCYQRLNRLDKAFRSTLFSHRHDPILHYLFWMSTVWRMAISKTELHMHELEQEKLRHILNLHLPQSYHPWQASSPQALGKCAYRLQKVQHIYDHDLNLTAVHEPSCPYVIIIGPYVLKWYNSINLFIEVADRVGDDVETINIGYQREKIGHISVFEYGFDVIGIEQTNHIYDRKMASWIMRTLPDVTTIQPFPKEIRVLMNQPIEDMNEHYGNRVDVIDRF